MNTKLILAAAFASQINATSCKVNEYADWIPYFLQGFQQDTTLTTTDCYVASDNLVLAIQSTTYDFKNFDFQDWLAPMYSL